MDQTLDFDNELKLLQSRLNQREDKIEAWLTDGTKHMTEAQNNKHAEFLQKGLVEVKRIQAAIASKQQQAANRNQAMEQYCKQLETLKAELLKLGNHSDELRIHQKQFQSEGEFVSKEIGELKSSLESESKTREKLDYLNKACGCFEGVLGLSFKKTKGNRMQVILNNIDEKDPSMQFYFFLQVENGSRQYVVTDTQPEITGLPELVEKLNTTNNLRAFMINIRKRFKETVKS